MRSLFAMTAGPSQVSYAPQSDILITAVTVCGTGGSACISLDPSADAAALTGAAGVYTNLIALFLSSPYTGVMLQVSYPVRKGEIVYFSADASALFQVIYDDLPAE